MSRSPAMSRSDSSNVTCGQDRPPVALIAGPTAGGKSAVALHLAETTGGVIINADASQVYADLAIITARPDADEMAHAPHRLFGHVDGLDSWSAARWAGEARAEIDAAHAAGHPAILVGGTGLYLDTLLNGIAPVPDIALAIREAVRALPVSETYAALQREDPQAAARLNAADTSRVARALEVVRSTGKPLAHWQAQRVGGIGDTMRILGGVVIRPRDELAARAAKRLTMMLETGAVEEVAALLARHLPSDRPVLRALGVPEIAALLSGDIDLTEAHARILKGTVAYQKRQFTWARGRQGDWASLDPDMRPVFDDLAPLSGAPR